MVNRISNNLIAQRTCVKSVPKQKGNIFILQPSHPLLEPKVTLKKVEFINESLMTIQGHLLLFMPFVYFDFFTLFVLRVDRIVFNVMYAAHVTSIASYHL